MTRPLHFPLSRELETWLGKPTPKQTFFRKMIFWMHFFWIKSKLIKAIKFLSPIIIWISPLSATFHSLICRQKKFPAEVFLSSWQGRYRCRLVYPLRALVSRFQRRFFLKKCVSRVQKKSVSQLALRACFNYHPLANGHTKRQRRQREKLPALHLGNTLCPVSSRLMAEITRNRNGHTRSVKCSEYLAL